MKKSLRKIIKRLDKFNGYEPMDYDEYKKQFSFCVHNYSMELNGEILKIAKSTHTTIEMLDCEDKTAFFRLTL